VFYRKSGLGALPVGLFNGVPLSSEEMDPEELETVLLQKIMETTNFFQRSVFMVWYYFPCQLLPLRLFFNLIVFKSVTKAVQALLTVHVSVI